MESRATTRRLKPCGGRRRLGSAKAGASLIIAPFTASSVSYFLELPTPTSPIRTLSRRHLPTYGHGLDGPRASDLPTYPTFEGC